MFGVIQINVHGGNKVPIKVAFFFFFLNYGHHYSITMELPMLSVCRLSRLPNGRFG